MNRTAYLLGWLRVDGDECKVVDVSIHSEDANTITVGDRDTRPVTFYVSVGRDFDHAMSNLRSSVAYMAEHDPVCAWLHARLVENDAKGL